MGFLTSADIGNRACQHCGVPRMDAVLGFTEGTERANEIGFAYGKVKRAELQRNIWTFATRRAALRAIDTNTMLVQPAMWMSTTTYFQGSIVSDQNGFLWISKIRNNLGNQPQSSYTWEPYFGPLTVSAYDSTQTYFAGELVYIAPGDGTYNVYLSLISGNALDPSLRNVWSAQAIYFQNNVVIVYPAYAGGTTYGAGATVLYTDGITYSSLAAGNTGNTPPTSPTKWAPTPILSLTSQQVPVVTAVQPPTTSPVIEYASGTVYSLGSFVQFNGKEYVSLASNNTGNQPNLAGSSSFWAQLSGGTAYMSLIDLNANNNPSSAPALWAIGTTYAVGNTVGGSDGVIYSSVGSGNVGHDPTLDGGVHWTSTGVLNPWTTVFVQGAGNQQWTQVGGAAFPAGVALTVLDIAMPQGAGPVSQAGTKNVYRLPAGFLRPAPQNPKAGVFSWLGVPGNDVARDWTYENNCFVTWESAPIVFRFVADVVDVTTFDDMFCEGLAARLAMEVVQTLTQSTAKESDIKADYVKFMGEARQVNSIEVGPVTSPLDDYIAARA